MKTALESLRSSLRQKAKVDDISTKRRRTGDKGESLHATNPTQVSAASLTSSSSKADKVVLHSNYNEREVDTLLGVRQPPCGLS